MPTVLAGAILTPTETAFLWGLHHPYWLFAIAIALIIFLQLSISLIGQLLRRLLKWLGKSPFFLVRWLLAKIPSTSSAPTDELVEQKLISILARLENLQKEQALILTELQTTLSARDIQQKSE